MNRLEMKSLIALMFLVILLPIASVYAEDGIALTWQNKAGYWFGCGPIQCTQVGYKTEKEILDLVVSDNAKSYSYKGRYGRCNKYTAYDIPSWARSAEKVKRLAKCK